MFHCVTRVETIAWSRFCDRSCKARSMPSDEAANTCTNPTHPAPCLQEKPKSSIVTSVACKVRRDKRWISSVRSECC